MILHILTIPLIFRLLVAIAIARLNEPSWFDPRSSYFIKPSFLFLLFYFLFQNNPMLTHGVIFFGASSGNRTRTKCLGSTCSAIKLYLHLFSVCTKYSKLFLFCHLFFVSTGYIYRLIYDKKTFY